jgi:uncharacterized iron-regulated membrane protein
MDMRRLHRKLAPVIIIPLLLTAFSGMAFRTGRSWFGLSDDFGDFMMVIHEGRFLGKSLVPVYVLLVGAGLMAMVATGFSMIKKRRKHSQSESRPAKLNARLLHGILTPVFFLPLLVSASTGIIYRLEKAWLGLSTEQTNFFLNIHQGSYLGKDLRALYVLIVGLGLLAIVATGITMTGILRKRSVA